MSRKKIIFLTLFIIIVYLLLAFIFTIPPKNPSNQKETLVINNKQYIVKYVPKEEIYPAFGYARDNIAIVREDLKPRVKQFVRAHELYHCQDESSFGGWLGKEFRANFIPGLKDLWGLLATIWDTITDKDRMNFYFKRLEEGK